MKRITLRNRKGKLTGYSTVDDEDAEWAKQWAWRKNNTQGPRRKPKFYAARWIDDPAGRSVAIWLHRAILERKEGRELGRRELTDHVDPKRTLNNRRGNLRVADYRLNRINRAPKRKGRP